MSTELTEVAASEEHLWNGVVQTPEGRLFASMPAWLGPTPGVVEVLPDGSIRPFPGDDWNRWGRSGASPDRCFVDVNSIVLDGRGSLWVVDAAAPFFGPAIDNAVKLVELDVASGRTRRVITLPSTLAHAGTRLAHMRFHGEHAFVAESKEGSMFVVDLRDGKVRRVLAKHSLMRCAPGDVPVIEGRRMTQNGHAMYFHHDLLAYGTDPDQLLFMCLFGRRIFQVPVAALKDPSLDDAGIAALVSIAFELEGPFVSGVTHDRAGRLYLADGENSGIARLERDGSVTPLVHDPRLSWPIGPSIGADGALYVIAGQVHRTPQFSGGEDQVQRPWRMFRFPLPP